MKKKVVYVDLSGKKYKEAERGDFNLQVLKAVSCDMRTVSERMQAEVRKLNNKCILEGPLSESDENFLKVNSFCADLLSEASINAEKLYEYLAYLISYEENEEDVKTDFDFKGVQVSISRLVGFHEALIGCRDLTKVGEKGFEWARIMKRAYGHAFTWKLFFDEI